jgi:zinc/manganese transport system ATP-binding protein
MTTAIALDHVTVSLSGRRVLAEVSLAIEAGEFIGLLGPNGSGKTTLMRALLGLIAPARGKISVFGAPPGRGNSAIGYLPQIRTLPGSARISGWDFVASAYEAHRWGLPLHDAHARAELEWALEVVGAIDLAKRPLAELSGGERQRLLLGQALIARPKLLLLDEPLMSLDPRHQEAVIELVARLHRDLGVTVLFSAHEINPLVGVLDRVLYLGGADAAIGSVEEVITGPVLSRLYGSAIDVIRVEGRIFVMSGGHDVEHEHHGHHHDHV